MTLLQKQQLSTNNRSLKTSQNNSFRMSNSTQHTRPHNYGIDLQNPHAHKLRSFIYLVLFFRANPASLELSISVAHPADQSFGTAHTAVPPLPGNPEQNGVLPVRLLIRNKTACVPGSLRSREPKLNALFPSFNQILMFIQFRIL